MNISFLLHFYQPSTQDEATFRQIYTNCYEPLLKLVRNKKNSKFTFNISLSLLEQLDRYGYNKWIDGVKDLLNAERIELTGSAAYHPLLTKISEKTITDNIILNEYGIGYYFGTHKGFDGEPSIMLKDLNGFFPPEMALNNSVLSILGSLGYKWVVGDETLISFDDIAYSKDEILTGVYTYKEIDSDLKIVVRDTNISTQLAFKRDGNPQELLSLIDTNYIDLKDIVIALDAETFGHHNSLGILLLESFIDQLTARGHSIVTVSELVDTSSTKSLHMVTESTWALNRAALKDSIGNVYKFWTGDSNGLQQKVHDFESLLVSVYEELDLNINSKDGFETTNLWDSATISKIPDINTANFIVLYMLIHKSLQSDKYWWLSNESIDGKTLYNTSHLMKINEYYSQIVSLLAPIVPEKSLKNLQKSLEALVKALKI